MSTGGLEEGREGSALTPSFYLSSRVQLVIEPVYIIEISHDIGPSYQTHLDDLQAHSLMVGGGSFAQATRLSVSVMIGFLHFHFRLSFRSR